MKFTTLLALILVVFSAQVFSQTTPAPKKRSSLIQVDRDLSKIFGTKKEKKVKTKKPKKEKAKSKTEKPMIVEQPKKDKPVVEILPVNSGLETNMMPKHYLKRTEAVFNIGLIYYGELYTEEEFARVQELLEKRFEDATNGLLKLNIMFRAIMPFEHDIKFYPDYKKTFIVQEEPELITAPITDVEKLQRLWYYDNKGMSVVSEVYNKAKSHNLYGKEFTKLDALAVVTGAQFEGLGFASGRVAVTENPMEIAWNRSSGRTEIQSDAKVVDELIHELGHTLALGHSSDQCFKDGISYEDSQACCAASENRQDVLSYCRKRALVDENTFYGFEACNQRNIKNKIIPAMLSGGEWEIRDFEKCL